MLKSKQKIYKLVNLPQSINPADLAGDLIKQIISECENRLELEERKRRENCDRVKTLIFSKKQEFEKSINS